MINTPHSVVDAFHPVVDALHNVVDALHHVIDVVGRANPVFRRLDAQRFAVVEKCLNEFRGVVANGNAGLRGVGDDAGTHH